jgi:hypothetical protein
LISAIFPAPTPAKRFSDGLEFFYCLKTGEFDLRQLLELAFR